MHGPGPLIEQDGTDTSTGYARNQGAHVQVQERDSIRRGVVVVHAGRAVYSATAAPLF